MTTTTTGAPLATARTRVLALCVLGAVGAAVAVLGVFSAGVRVPGVLVLGAAVVLSLTVVFLTRGGSR